VVANILSVDPQFHVINLRQANFLLGYNSTTNGFMWEWISQLDSAPQIGPETTLKVFLIVVGSWSAVGWKSSENFQSRVLTVLAIAPQPKELWPNGDCRRIQRPE
jgi:hypothetical protein